MKYVIKFLALTALAGAVIYTFFVQPELSTYGFWLWLFSVTVSLVTIGNYVSLIAACTTENDNETEKGFLILSSFLSSIVFASIFLYTMRSDYTDWSYLLCCSIVYMLSSGFNKRTWSFVFLGLTQTLFFCLDCIQMNTWHSWGLYILFTIAHIVCIAVVIFDRMDSDPIPKIELAGLFIPVAAVSYIWAINNAFLDCEINTMILLCYIIVSLFASLRDDTSTYISISIVSLLYLFFLSNHYENVVMMITGGSMLLAGIAHYLYKSRMTTILAYTMGENKLMIAKYNNLVENYNQAVDYLNNISSQSANSYNGQNESSFEKGVYSGIGSTLVRGGFELLSALLGG